MLDRSVGSGQVQGPDRTGGETHGGEVDVIERPEERYVPSVPRRTQNKSTGQVGRSVIRACRPDRILVASREGGPVDGGPTGKIGLDPRAIGYIRPPQGPEWKAGFANPDWAVVLVVQGDIDRRIHHRKISVPWSGIVGGDGRDKILGSWREAGIDVTSLS